MIKLFFISLAILSTNAYSKFSVDGEIQEKALEKSYKGHDGYTPFHAGYFNSNLVLDLNEKREIRFNWLFRYYNSEALYKENVPFRSLVYPARSISRNMFKLSKKDTGKYSYTESTLNEFNYNFKDGDTSVSLGRMFVHYGEGMTFNPINPFHRPLLYSNFKNNDQGNDGMIIALHPNDKTTLNIYLFGNQDLEDKNENVSRTIFLNASINLNSKNHLHLIAGEDQQRQTSGFEYKYSFDKGLFFIQGMSKSKRLDLKDESEKVYHALTGLEYDFSKYFSSRIETGHEGHDKKLGVGERSLNYIALHNFYTLINQISLSDKTRLNLNYTRDFKTTFGYLQTELGYKASKNLEYRAFYSKTVSLKEKHKDAASQNSLPVELGLSLAFNF